MKDFKDISDSNVDESIGSRISLAALIGLLAIPKIVDAEDFRSSLPKANVTAADVQTVLDNTEKESADDYGGYTIVNAANIIARTLYYEARGEGEEGIDAVASVIFNRAEGNPKYLAKVCLAKMQFSCWNNIPDLTPDKYKFKIPIQAAKPGKNQEMWRYCQKTAGKLIYKEFKSTIGKCNAYHNDEVNPKWDALMTDKVTKGHHIFGHLNYYDNYTSKLDKPAKKVVKDKTKVNKASDVQQAKSVKNYKVKNKDTLYNIASKNNTTVEKLLALNKGLNPKKLKIGSIIKIPI